MSETPMVHLGGWVLCWCGSSHKNAWTQYITAPAPERAAPTPTCRNCSPDERHHGSCACVEAEREAWLIRNSQPAGSPSEGGAADFAALLKTLREAERQVGRSLGCLSVAEALTAERRVEEYVSTLATQVEELTRDNVKLREWLERVADAHSLPEAVSAALVALGPMDAGLICVNCGEPRDSERHDMSTWPDGKHHAFKRPLGATTGGNGNG